MALQVDDQRILREIQSFEPYRAQGLLPNIVIFCRILKRLKLDVTTSHALDVFRGLRHIDIANRADFYELLRANLVGRHEDFELFDRTFRYFWRRPEEPLEDEGCAPSGDHQCDDLSPEGVPQEPQMEEILDQEEAEGEGEAEEEEWVKAFSPDEVLAGKDFSHLDASEVQALRRIIAEIAKKIATKISRRWEGAVHGKQVDMRRTMRRNIKYGGDILELARRRRKIRKNKIVMLCDVSGSMDCYTTFLIQFIYGLQNELKDVETFVFSTRLTRITPLLKRRQLDEALKQISEMVVHWSGGTRIGESLRNFNESHAPALVSSRSIILLISDGWDRGDIGMLEREMTNLKRRAYKVIWLNPLLGSPNYEPLCKGMQAALPHIDFFMPVHNLRSLAALGKTITALT
ncbi:MAG: VWA domain-containing protein [Deltaproteobacteria bacterium]|nr:VWA domain-containing protein [Deltaproteobacteria bacterium]MBI3078108.1 VWA domain-containing protein [Deltaproteobacteria bacterium]